MHMIWPMTLPSSNPIMSCLIKIQSSFFVLVPACLGCPVLENEAVKQLFLCASVAQLEEAKKKVEEEKVAAEEARATQQLLGNAKVSCINVRYKSGYHSSECW